MALGLGNMVALDSMWETGQTPVNEDPTADSVNQPLATKTGWYGIEGRRGR